MKSLVCAELISEYLMRIKAFTELQKYLPTDDFLITKANLIT